MTDDRSLYYEISLSNRQVLVAIVLLLACVVLAFLSGVWVGRESRIGEVQMAALGESGEEPSETFAFFKEEPGESVETRSPQAAPPSRGKVENLQDVQSAPAAEPAQKAQTTPREAEPSVRSEQPQSAPQKPPERPAPKAPPEQPATPPAEAADAKTAAKSDGEPQVIQVFSSADENQAQAVLDKLRRGGFRAFLAPIEVDGRTMYRVRVGPFNEPAVAQVEADRLKREYRLDTWITAASN